MWIIDVSKRFAAVDKKSRSSVTGILSAAGIACGAMTLITVMSVMNGFQRSFIDAILELSSYHVRVTDVPSEKAFEFTDFCENNSDIETVSPFYEAQGLVVGRKTNECAAIIRGIDKNILNYDKGFEKEINVISGDFNLNEEDSVLLGSYLAKRLGVRCGDYINLMALSGGKDVALFSQNRILYVSGIFECGYSEINQAYAFISLEGAERYFGKDAVLTYGIKLKKTEKDGKVIKALKKAFPEAEAVSWREYNRSYFGTLRVEKNIMKIVVCLIFLVVCINIYNGMRRLVYERSQEIAVLSAFGARKNQIKSIFLFRGFINGFSGSVSGTILGIFISLHMDKVFMAISRTMFFFDWLFTKIFSPENLSYVSENPMYSIYASIPPKIFPGEVVFVSLFALLAPLIASFFASSGVLKLKISEVLHYE